MIAPPEFELRSASNPSRLMDELEKFIICWLGPRREQSGEPESILKDCQLPEPLRRLYSFAGRWTRPHGEVDEETGIFSIQDHLRTLDQLERTPDCKLIFLDENSGNWICATLP